LRQPAPLAQDELENMPFDESELEPDQTWEEEAVAPEAEPADAPVVPAVVPEPIVEAAPAPIEQPAAPVIAAAPEPNLDATRAFIRSLMTQPAPEKVRFDDDQEDFAPLAEQVPGHDFDFDRDYEQEQASVFEPEPIAPLATAMPERPQRLLRYTDLVSDLVLGRTHLLLLADHGNDLAGRAFAEELCADAL